MAWIGMTGQVQAQDFQIGGDQQRETSVPLEVRPSLGVFVLGYVNGRGPYRFSIGMAQHTQLTAAVVMDAGLATRDRGVILDGATNHFEQYLQLTDASLRLGDRELSLNGAQVFPEHDPSAYVPVPNYGGALGIEVFRKGIVRLDLSHARLVFSSQTDTAQSSDAIELPLDQSAIGSDMDRMPAVTLSLSGQPGKFRVSFSAASVYFLEDSPVGRVLLDRSPHRVTIRDWTPDGIIRTQAGTADQFEPDVQRNASIARRLDPIPMPLQSPHIRVIVREPPVDGVIGLRMLGGFDITIDDLAGKMWLTPRDRNPFVCRGLSQGNFHGTTGFTPWLYKEQGVVRSVADGSPAEAAGIEPGDQIVSIDDGDVPAYYEHLKGACTTPAPVKVVFHNASGEHTVVLTPAKL